MSTATELEDEVQDPAVEQPNWDELATDLAGLIAMAGFGLSFVSPTGGRVLMNRASKATENLLELAQRDERLADFLVRFLGRARYASLVEVLGEVVVAVGVDYGVILPNSPLTMPIAAEVQQTLEQVAAMQQAQAQAAPPPAPEPTAPPAEPEYTEVGPQAAAPNGYVPDPAPVGGET